MTEEPLNFINGSNRSHKVAESTN